MSYTPAEQRIVEKSAERVHLALARIAGARAQFTMDGEPMDVAAFIAVNQQDDLDYMGEILADIMDRLAGLKPGEELTAAGGAAAEFTFKRVVDLDPTERLALTDGVLAAMEDLVRRCDGEDGVRDDGSNIDTAWAHAALAAAKATR